MRLWPRCKHQWRCTGWKKATSSVPFQPFYQVRVYGCCLACGKMRTVRRGYDGSEPGLRQAMLSLMASGYAVADDPAWERIAEGGR